MCEFSESIDEGRQVSCQVWQLCVRGDEAAGRLGPVCRRKAGWGTRLQASSGSVSRKTVQSNIALCYCSVAVLLISF